jgi:hypothetical protein
MAKPYAIKGSRRRCGGCAAKVAGLTWGGLHGCPVMPGHVGVIAGWRTVLVERPVLAVEKSAEAIVPAGSLIAGKG